jgi:hypothetical protein
MSSEGGEKKRSRVNILLEFTLGLELSKFMCISINTTTNGAASKSLSVVTDK